MLFVCHAKILHNHNVFSISWELKWPQEKLKTMLMQNLEWPTKSIMGGGGGLFLDNPLIGSYKVYVTKKTLQMAPTDGSEVFYPSFWENVAD